MESLSMLSNEVLPNEVEATQVIEKAKNPKKKSKISIDFSEDNCIEVYRQQPILHPDNIKVVGFVSSESIQITNKNNDTSLNPKKQRTVSKKIKNKSIYFDNIHGNDNLGEGNLEYHNETKIKLKQLLDSSCSNEIHTKKIMALPTLKDAHIYCKCNSLSGQFTGPVLEKYIKTKYKMTKNNASSCNGDLKCNEINVEIKASNGGKENNKFNFVQLRMNHDCIYILTAYYLDNTNVDNLGDLYIFKLNKENIKLLIVKYGGYAHGTIGGLGEITIEDLNDPNNTKEYALRPKYGDKCWMELLNFRIDELII